MVFPSYDKQLASPDFPPLPGLMNPAGSLTPPGWLQQLSGYSLPGVVTPVSLIELPFLLIIIMTTWNPKAFREEYIKLN